MCLWVVWRGCYGLSVVEAMVWGSWWATPSPRLLGGCLEKKDELNTVGECRDKKALVGVFKAAVGGIHMEGAGQ
jgi:hypothetical protein